MRCRKCLWTRRWFPGCHWCILSARKPLWTNANVFKRSERRGHGRQFLLEATQNLSIYGLVWPCSGLSVCWQVFMLCFVRVPVGSPGVFSFVCLGFFLCVSALPLTPFFAIRFFFFGVWCLLVCYKDRSRLVCFCISGVNVCHRVFICLFSQCFFTALFHH